ncbi:MAG: glycosyltransferase family 4 protein [Bacteroidetes bacterium]|nr:glycosyltransferase family 4 protein [Bacteroidota bacterium]
MILKNMRIAVVTNIPAPYRELAHRELSKELEGEYKVFYCNKIEKDRSWKLKLLQYDKEFLDSKNINIGKKNIYFNFSIWKKLNAYNPDVVITGGFVPTMLLAWFWSVKKHKKHIPYTDANLLTEKRLTSLHRFIRKKVYGKSNAFLSVGEKGKQFYESYNIAPANIFKSPYVVDNNKFMVDIDKEYDVIFSGQFIKRKMPLFFAEVANILNTKYKCSVKALILGNGQDKNKFINKLEQYAIDYTYPGFVQQDILPKYFAMSKIFLFPTERDAWGVVANEACAAGLPVITCDNAGVANDLVQHNYNGYVLPLDAEDWAKHVYILLNKPEKYAEFSKNAQETMENFNKKIAAKGILDACVYAMAH